MPIYKPGILILGVLIKNVVGLDLTRVSGAAGEDVVDAVLQQITDSEFLKDDKQFLKRLALVTSGYGRQHITYESDY